MHPSQALSPCRTAYIRSLALTACLLVGLAEAVRASGPTGATIYVDAGATGANDGSSWCDAFLHPQDALSAAAAGDTILVADGAYMPDGGYVPVGGTHVPGNADRTATFQLVTGVTLEGGYAGCGAEDPDQRDVDAFQTILSGDLNGNDDGFTNNDENSYHVVTGSGTDATAVLDGFTITAGNANGAFPNSAGGGMYNSSSSNPTVTNCTFSGNSADRGGGMYNSGGSPAVTNCTFSGNSADRGGGGMYNVGSSPAVTNCTFSDNSPAFLGGGMYNTFFSSPRVTHCTFAGNSAGFGGGMYNADSSPAVTHCTFSGNSADRGGGMYNGNSGPVVTNCTFSGNSANNGGGMLNDLSRPAVTNCTFSGNSANGDGGGMYNTNSSPTVINCGFSDNSASSNGGGMHNFGSSPAVTDCTFSGNSANNRGGGMVNTANSRPAVTNCTFSGNSADLGGGMLNLSLSSPAVTNCVLWGNVDDADGNNGGPFMDESAQIHTASGNPTVNYSIVQGGWSGAGGVGVAHSDPLFINPDGADGVPGTDDDDLHLKPRSPAIDAGRNNVVPPDLTDLDGDGDTAEPTPLDLDANPRFVDDPVSPDCPHGGACGTAPIVDMGAYEFQAVCENDPDCDDGIACTDDTCVDGRCVITPDHANCDDGLLCDGAETCEPANPNAGADGCVAGSNLCPAQQVCDEVADVCVDPPPILFVDDDAPPGGDGTTWATAFNNLQNALSLAQNDAVEAIWVADGTYRPDQGTNQTPGNRTATFQLQSGVALYGGLAGNEDPQTFDLADRDFQVNISILSGDLNGDDAPVACTQDSPDCDAFGRLCGDDGFCIIADSNAENSYHVVTGSGTDGSAVLDGFTITAGKANGFNPNDRGGGMYNEFGSPTVTDCTFSGNWAGHGGGMFNEFGSPMVTDCAFSGNWADLGGGMFNFNGSSPAVTNCTFSDNSANNGGGMHNFNSSPTVTNCMFSGNSAGASGGGMYNIFASPAVTHCTFSGNSAGSGGGMYNTFTSSPAVTNCTFSGNSADLGGGMHNSDSSPTVTNCVLWGNVDDADGNGGGPFMDESAQIHTASGNPTVNYSIVQGGWSGAGGIGVADSDPLFADPDGPDDVPGTEDDDLRLKPGSPAIDAGSNDAVPPDLTDLDGDGDTDEPTPLDLDGNPRFVDNPGSPDCPHGGDCGTPPIVDMGAYEFQAVCENDPDCDDGLFCDGVETCEPANPNAGADGCVAGSNLCPAQQVCDEVADACVDPPPILFVDDDAPPGGDGTTWATAFNNLQNALSLAQNDAVEAIWVADGTYRPDQGTNQTPGNRTATFQLQSGVALYGGLAGNEDPQTFDLADRDFQANISILSGDLNGDDAPVACTQDSPDCDAFGRLCGDDGFCIIADSNAENSYHVVTGSGTDGSAVLDGFTITAGKANGFNPNDRGGGMYNEFGSPTVTDCTFSGNSTSFFRGGGMYNTNSSPAVTNCTFSDNSANNGGGMYNFNSSPVVTNCAFSGNSADLGGGMYNINSSPAVTNCTFSDNSANNGGGMYNFNSSPVVTNCAFSGNSADLGGGMYNSNSSPAVTNCTFSGNSADRGGGMYIANGSNAVVTNCAFNGNSASSNGGGMLNANSSPAVTNCTFSGNSANAFGGGMLNTNTNNNLSSPTVTNCTFSDNSANLHGGGMFNSSGSPAVTNCTFSGNSANDRGGGMNNGGSSPAVTNCTFSGNSANNGGGMYNANNNLSSPTVTNCTFSGNSANDDGGGMYNAGGSPTVTNCTFSDNSASFGGGMYNTNSSPAVTDCMLSDNSAGLGGGMYNGGSGSPTVTNCTFSGNSAYDFGGGMLNFNASPTVTNCVLWGNVDDADGNGGGPFMDESAQIHTASGNPTVNYSIVQGGWTGAGGVGVADADPLFADPDGPDNVPGTEDDDLRLMPGSPAIDAGRNDAVPPDVADLDGDGDTDEPTPLDLDGNPRFVDNPGSPDCPHAGACGTPPIVDMGPYEFACLFTGDSDGNGDIDLFDYQAYLDCAGGPGLPPPPEGDPPTSECDVFDANCDGDIDLFDWGALQAAFAGS